MTPEQSINFLNEHKDDLNNYIINEKISHNKAVTLDEFLHPSLTQMIGHYYLYINSDNKYLKDIFNVLKERKNVSVFFTDMNLDDMLEILNKYDDVIDNKTLFTFKNLRYKPNDYENITKEQFIKMIKRIKEIVNYINHFNLSNYEKTIFLYDLIKQKKYKDSNNDKQNNSLYQVLFDENITCLGYSNIFQIVLEELGYDIAEHDISVRYENDAHSITSVKIEDPKYNINGTYIYDITIDNFARIMENGELNINSYDGLSQPKTFVKKYIDSIPKRIENRVSNDAIPEHIVKQALYNVRKVANSIDYLTYDMELSNEDFDSLSMLSEKEANENVVISSLRELLREKMKNSNSTKTDNISEELKYLLEDNPQLQEELENLLVKAKKSPSYENVIDYTENPIIRR